MLKRLKIVIALSLVFSSLAFSNAQLNAEDGYTEVSTTEEFLAAIERQEPKIRLTESITVTEKVNITNDVEIDGGNNVVTYEGDIDGWQGNYILQFYESKAVIRNIHFSGGDAAILVNGSKLSVEGVLGFDDQEFGGIELSQGKNVMEKSKLSFGSNIDIYSYTETYEVPTIWIDSNGGSIAKNDLIKGERDLVKGGKNQTYFYLSDLNDLKEKAFSLSLFPHVVEVVEKYPYISRKYVNNMVVMKLEDINDLGYRKAIGDFIFFVVTNLNEGEYYSFTKDGEKYHKDTDRKLLYLAAQDAADNYRQIGSGNIAQDYLIASEFFCI